MRNNIYSLLIFFLLSGCYEEEVFIGPFGMIKRVNTFHEFVEVEAKADYFYNENKQLVKKIINQNGKEKGEILYNYNSNGQLIREENMIPGEHELNAFHYDENGKLINQSGTNESFDIFYDSLDRVISKKYYSNVTKDYIRETKYLYDTLFINRIKYEFQDYMTLEYIYNNEGKLEQKKLIDGHDWLFRGTLEYYTYDKQGRLLNKLFYELNTEWHYFGLDKTESYFYFD